MGYHYTLRIKSNQPDLLDEAKRRLGDDKGDSGGMREPEYACETLRYGGVCVHYRVWTCPTLRGFLRWRHLRQFSRIERIVEREVDCRIERVVGERYFVTSMRPSRMCAKTALDTVCAYWRCENEQHWTADTGWNEDARHAPMSRLSDGMKNASLLRLIAMAIARSRAASVASTKGGQNRRGAESLPGSTRRSSSPSCLPRESPPSSGPPTTSRQYEENGPRRMGRGELHHKDALALDSNAAAATAS